MTLPQVLNVEEEDIGERLDIFLVRILPNFSRSKIQQFIADGIISVNQVKAKCSFKLRANDKIFFDTEEIKTLEILPENIPLDIRYEDDNILVVNKPKNMLTHPTFKETSGTLVNALMYYCKENLSNINLPLRPGIVHRLDRNTTGLLLIAKNNATYENLYLQIKNRFIIKKYLTIVHGNFEKESGEIDSPIGRNLKHPEKMCIRADGKLSKTQYKVLEQFNGFAYLDVNLLTGRTHQIRVHLSSIGHPIVNDSLYNKIKFKVKTQEQILQAYELTFKNPTDNNIITITLEPDETVKKVLNYLRSKK